MRLLCCIGREETGLPAKLNVGVPRFVCRDHRQVATKGPCNQNLLAFEVEVGCSTFRFWLNKAAQVRRLCEDKFARSPSIPTRGCSERKDRRTAAPIPANGQLILP